MTIPSFNSKLFSELLDFIFPPRCFACGELLARNAYSIGVSRCFCPLCADAVLPLSTPRCSCCGEPFIEGTRDHLCGVCLRYPPAFGRVIAPFEYGGPLAVAISKFKYNRATCMAKELGRLMGASLVGEYDGVIPVPLHGKRLVQRGFNQSALLANEVAGTTGLRVWAGLLRRERVLEAQVGKTRKERMANMKNAFGVHDPRNRLEGKRVLLVDDVVTTTATVRAAADVLKQQGRVASVEVLCLGRSIAHG